MSENFEKYGKGVIYKLTCNTSKKSYVGQAKNFTSGKVPWGAQGRWKSHIREAINAGKDNCLLLNQAIRKYGPNDFILETIGEFWLTELDKKEDFFINEFKTMVPHGYNLNLGGQKGKDSEKTRLNKKLAKQKYYANKVFTPDERAKISISQIGNRRGTKKRKYEEDNQLPKYINAVRDSKELVYGYSIDKFPIGVTDKNYISERFVSRENTPEENFELAVEYLEKLKLKYAWVDEAIKAQREQIIKERIEAKLANKVKDSQDLPKHIHPIVVHHQHIGYYVDGVKDHDGKVFPRKDFTSTQAKWRNLENAKKHLTYLMMKKTDSSILVPDFTKKAMRKNTEDEKLPEYISFFRQNGEIKGYQFGGFVLEGKRINKKFTSTKFSMQERLAMALQFKEEMLKLKDDPYYEVPVELQVQKKPKRPEELPKHIGYLKKKDKIIGYQIYGFQMPDGKKIGKVFTGVNLTMEEKYKKALQCLKQLEKEREAILKKDNGSEQQTTLKII